LAVRRWGKDERKEKVGVREGRRADRLVDPRLEDLSDTRRPVLRNDVEVKVTCE
jgi:hypothetical protein